MFFHTASVKRIGLTFIALLLASSIQAQISVRKDTRNLPVLKVKPYDSLQRFIYRDTENKGNFKEARIRSEQELQQYVGHKLYFIPFVGDELRLRETAKFWYVTRDPVDSTRMIPREIRYEKTCLVVAQNCVRKPITFNKRGKVKKNGGTKTAVYRPAYRDAEETSSDNALGKLDRKVSTALTTADSRKFYTPHENFEGGYFRILGFQTMKDDPTIEEGDIRMYLEDDQGDTLAMEDSRYDWNSDGYPEFMLVSFYEKYKKTYTNRSFIYTPGRYSDSQSEIEINSGYEISMKKGSEWECTAFDFLDVKEAYLEPFLIMKNEKGEEIKVSVFSERLGKNLLISSFTSKKKWLRDQELAALAEEERKAREAALEAERKAEAAAREEHERLRKEAILKKYGQKMGQLINEDKVVIGMTKEMAELAWGTPLEVNKTVMKNYVMEQWVYSLTSYLYFENGELTAIQN